VKAGAGAGAGIEAGAVAEAARGTMVSGAGCESVVMGCTGDGAWGSGDEGREDVGTTQGGDAGVQRRIAGGKAVTGHRSNLASTWVTAEQWRGERRGEERGEARREDGNGTAGSWEPLWARRTATISGKRCGCRQHKVHNRA
jgi:hypothetical protein